MQAIDQSINQSFFIHVFIHSFNQSTSTIQSVKLYFSICQTFTCTCIHVNTVRIALQIFFFNFVSLLTLLEASYMYKRLNAKGSNCSAYCLTNRHVYQLTLTDFYMYHTSRMRIERAHNLGVRSRKLNYTHHVLMLFGGGGGGGKTFLGFFFFLKNKTY